MCSRIIIILIILVSDRFTIHAFLRFDVVIVVAAIVVAAIVVAAIVVAAAATLICIAATTTHMKVIIASHRLVGRTNPAIKTPLLACRSPAALLLLI